MSSPNSLLLPKAIKNKNKTVSPLIIKNLAKHQTGDSSPSELSDFDWHEVQHSKHARSPNSNPSSPKPKKHLDKNIFVSQNQFAFLSNSTDTILMDTSVQTETIPNTSEIPKQPPIFIQTQVNYSNFCQKMLELIGNDGFECKSYQIDHAKSRFL